MKKNNDYRDESFYDDDLNETTIQDFEMLTGYVEYVIFVNDIK
jgi:hypothetical protein